VPYVKIETASTLRFPDGSRVTSPQAYLGWHTWHLADREVAQAWANEQPVQARIEHGRWVTNCASCGTGMFTHPVWQLACCGECGAVHATIVVPPNWQAIEAELLKRPVRVNQNWLPNETLETLTRESRAHGVR
jgi:hypothetical protein